jgi:fido (protein-threonine AMPylation protein)
MDKPTQDKLTKRIPEISSWSAQELEFLYGRMLDLKSKWKETTPEDDSLLFLGCALDWSKMVSEAKSLPLLTKSPSYYRDIARKHRMSVVKCAKSIAPKAQAWGGFWDPEEELAQDKKGWKERKSSIAPHIWISLKKKEFLKSINTPLEYENASLKGLVSCTTHFLQRNSTTPTLSSLLEAHKRLFSHISGEGGHLANKQLCYAGYVGSEPKDIPWEIEQISKKYEEGIKKVKSKKLYREAEIIRWTVFAASRLLRIHPFPSGNKRLLASWVLSSLNKELQYPENKKTSFWKNCHPHFMTMRTGEIAPICTKICAAFSIQDPSPDVPSFWLTPEEVTPIGIKRKRLEKTSNSKIGGFSNKETINIL